MMTRRNLLLCGVATAALLFLSSAGPALAASAEVVVTDRETVQVYMTATGDVKVARVYDQVTATGKGTVDLENPVSTDGLRNLDGLSGPDSRDGKAIQRISVDGEKRLRTVSTFDGELPVTIQPTYTLDGRVYEDPEDIVGKSGKLEVAYRIENVTSEPTTLTVKDGQGNDVQVDADVPLPLVGQLVTVLPKGFYSVGSDQASISADGRGGTRMTFTMTLLPPIGPTVAEIGYTAQVEDAVIPKATVSVAVVQPLKNPSLSSAAANYQGGAATGATLTAGAVEIDANLLKLRDGAGELLGGLLQLRDGAQQLNEGLAGEAAPGANQLADGAGEAAVGAAALAQGLKAAESGSGDLADGVGKIADGNKTLANGFNSPTGGADLVTGSQDLAAGLGLISGGLASLGAVDGLPKAYAGLQTLRLGIDHPIGAGGPTDPGGLLQALQQIAAGLSNSGCNPADPTNPANPCGVKETLASLATGLNQIAGGLNNPACDLSNPTNPANPCGVKQGVGGVRDGLSDALVPGGSVDQLAGAAGAANALSGCPGGTSPPPPAGAPTTACDYIAAIYWGVEAPSTGLRAKSTLARDSLSSVLGGVDQLIAGMTTATTGLTAIRAGVDKLAAGAVAARNGISQQVLPGIDQLLAGISGAVTGVGQLSAGAKTAAEGSGTLAEKIAEAGAGASQLAEGSRDAEVGSKQLADGLAAARDGSAQLADGNGRIAEGAGDLAEGLDSAASGSARLADGLDQAADGAPALVDGAQRLSDEGTKLLVEAGNDTALEFGENYAIIKAMADRTADGGLPYGPPEGATGSAAFSFELAAATNEGSRNLTRGLLAIVALGMGALLSTVVRARFF
jgi:putative membrane protein